MASSLTSPGLISAFNEALVKVNPEINIAKLFAYDMSDAFAEVNSTVKVPIIDGGSLSAFDISSNDYENTDGTVTYKTITLNYQPKFTFEFNGNDVLEAPNAPYWNTVAEGAARKVKAAISAKLGGLFTTTACAGGKVTMGSVTKKALAALRSEVIAVGGRPSDTVIGLAPEYYEDALSLFDNTVYGGVEAVRNGLIPNLYGFKAVIQLDDLPSGVKGVIIPQDAVAFASRAVAVADESCYREIGNVTDENGYTLTVMRHGSPAKGTGFLNATSLFGCALIKPDMVKYIAAS